jgi:hypothetical protein
MVRDIQDGKGHVPIQAHGGELDPAGRIEIRLVEIGPADLKKADNFS